jgi:hypothetical protein
LKSGFACLAAIAALLLAGCDDPMATRRPPNLPELRVFLIVDPDAASQPLLLQPVGARVVLERVRGEVRLDNQPVASITAPTIPENEFLPCAMRYGILDADAQPRCLDFRFAPRYGASYRVSVSADGFQEVSGTVTVPGDFSVRTVVSRGAPPGTQGLEAAWSRSTGVYRYVVTLRPTIAPECVRIRSCDQRWFAVTTDTTIQTTVPADKLAGGEGPWFLDVYAVDRPLYEYLTTGASGDLFPVPPVQNVQGGHGAVGAWLRRSKQL